MNNQLVQELMQFISASPTMFHATHTLVDNLESNGFSRLFLTDSWEIEKGGKYYAHINNSSIIAFIVNSCDIEKEGFRLVGTHTDVPSFKVKAKAQMQNDGYVKLNTEIYGGPILNSWFDRPLSLAGRAVIKDNDILNPKQLLVDFKKPILVIPNLAIHMDREINKGKKINPQKETLPILCYAEKHLETDLLLEEISKNLDVSIEDILGFDLFLYPVEEPMLVGIKEQFISAARLDNLSMTYSGLYGLLNSKSDKGISVLVCYDNEEVGSRTRQGANAPFLRHTLERIINSLGKDRDAFFRSLANSFMISADVAHLIHPNYTEKSDPTNKVLAGKGPAIKVSASYSYTTDSDSFAVFAGLCEANNIPYQTFFNRSDERGGSTIGPIATSQLGMRCVDVGTPMLAMHSARELMTCEDFIYTCEALKAFYNL
ncbi:MAG: M18 family aminopeptidase [Epulopiscium sp. Nele67-Bin005]|nr:MAG: M18 family aminopeptidase [Epulopiscium sp. Nele67-Bin005]